MGRKEGGGGRGRKWRDGRRSVMREEGRRMNKRRPNEVEKELGKRKGGEERRSLVMLNKVSPAGPILLRQELFTWYTCTIGVSTVPQTVSKA